MKDERRFDRHNVDDHGLVSSPSSQRFFEDYFDRDRDGAISWNDLYAVLEDRRANIPREEVIRLIDALDVNRDGVRMGRAGGG